jgi:hypothetical protein
MFRRRTKQEKLKEFGTDKVKEYSMQEAAKGVIYANELKEKYPWISYTPLILIGGIILLIMWLL